MNGIMSIKATNAFEVGMYNASRSLIEFGMMVLQIEKIVLFLIERQGLLAERLQRLRKQREVASQDHEETVESGLGAITYDGPAVVPWHMMDEYR